MSFNLHFFLLTSKAVVSSRFYPVKTDLRLFERGEMYLHDQDESCWFTVSNLQCKKKTVPSLQTRDSTNMSPFNWIFAPRLSLKKFLTFVLMLS